METIVFQTHVQMVEYGMKDSSHANVQTIRYGLLDHAYLQRSHVIMGEFGMKVFMHVSVHLEPTQQSTNVNKFPSVRMEESIIL